MKYVSLGFNCNVALALKNNNLKEETNIFDYLISNPESLLKILNEDVTDFLKDKPIFLKFKKNNKFLIIENSCKKKKDLCIYDKNINLIFPHDYNGTQQSIIDTKNKYKRRIIRFKNILKSKDKVLFIFSGKSDYKDYINNSHSIMSLEDKSKCEKYLIYLDKLSNYFKKNFSNLKFHILAFNLFDKNEDYEKNNFSHKYLGDCNGRKNMERKITKFIKNLKNKKIEPIFNNLNNFLD